MQCRRFEMMGSIPVDCIHQALFLFADKMTRLGDMGSVSANAYRHILQVNNVRYKNNTTFRASQNLGV